MMRFTLEIELGDVVNTPVEVAELLTGVLNEIREDGFTPGVHDVSTRPYWRPSADGEASELVRATVGKWEVVDDSDWKDCSICGTIHKVCCDSK